jgi:hypothetical protein
MKCKFPKNSKEWCDYKYNKSQQDHEYYLQHKNGIKTNKIVKNLQKIFKLCDDTLRQLGLSYKITQESLNNEVIEDLERIRTKRNDL